MRNWIMKEVLREREKWLGLSFCSKKKKKDKKEERKSWNEGLCKRGPSEISFYIHVSRCISDNLEPVYVTGHLCPAKMMVQNFALPRKKQFSLCKNSTWNYLRAGNTVRNTNRTTEQELFSRTVCDQKKNPGEQVTPQRPWGINLLLPN